MEDKKSDQKNSMGRDESNRTRRKIEKGFNLLELCDIEVSPELKSIFLNFSMALEKELSKLKRVTLYEFIGSPLYKKINELNDDVIDEEFNHIRSLLLQHQIEVEARYPVSKHELYLFITEELFMEEVFDFKIPGEFIYFQYEDYHPNYLYEIKTQSFMFLIFYFDQSSDKYIKFLSRKAAKQDWHVHFRKAFSSFDPEFTVTDTQYDLDLLEAHADVECDIMAMPEEFHNHVYFKGTGKLHLVYENDFWRVNSFELPAPLISTK